MKIPFLLLLPLLVSQILAAPSPTPAVIPATITYTDPKSGEEKTLSGKLDFEAWSIRLDGRTRKLRKRGLVSFNNGAATFRVWMRRADGDHFIICTHGSLYRAAFAFDRIGIGEALSKMAARSLQDAASMMGPGDGDEEDNDAEELDDGLEGKREPPPPVILRSEKPPGLKFIEVKHVKAIECSVIRWKDF